ncbi:hypothetical protein FGO68_gene8484 [Halteria grandinella]|uniref:Protein kinase domain-containing protein n=1 Tax=Halteria grandinella TaxID=5974 RepID=A0A8J8T5V0_HALGN|nr:hypothetical protein FGO68_gene8484 [Halteria grandinella]
MKISEKGIPEELALTWFTQTALALLQIHSQGLMHRDVKPSNILLFGEKIGGIAKLADFGTIKQDRSADQHTIKVGTFRYFAPERLLGEMDDYTGKADVWSLGISFHEMLTGGEHPFSSPDDKRYLQSIEANSLEIKESISKPVQELLKFLLVKDPGNRPEMKEVLNHPLVKNRIALITDNLINGEEIGNFIRDQVKDILEPSKESQNLTVSSIKVSPSIARQQFNIFKFFKQQWLAVVLIVLWAIFEDWTDFSRSKQIWRTIEPYLNLRLQNEYQIDSYINETNTFEQSQNLTNHSMAQVNKTNLTMTKATNQAINETQFTNQTTVFTQEGLENFLQKIRYLDIYFKASAQVFTKIQPPIQMPHFAKIQCKDKNFVKGIENVDSKPFKPDIHIFWIVLIISVTLHINQKDLHKSRQFKAKCSNNNFRSYQSSMKSQLSQI